MELKEIQDIVNTGLKSVEENVDKKFQGQFESSKEALVAEIEAKGYKTAEEIDVLIKEKLKDIEATVIDIKKAGLTEIKVKAKGFKAIIGAALTEAKNDLLVMHKKSGEKASIVLTKANEDLNDANFTGDSLEIATTDRARGLYMQPYMPQWFRNLLPQGTTSKGTIQYLKENGDVGAAGVWDGTGAIADLDAKPGTAPLFDDVTENVIWIAGITRVKRDMLDDIEWLQGYLARRLTTGRTGLWVAENVQIFNKLVANSTPYDGDKSIPVEMIYDAAFGQLADNYYFNPTILMNNRDLVSLIALNKADGSGEYDLPPGTVVVINGQLTIAGARVIGAPNVTAGTALVYDASATEFISRMSPEVRFFEEDRDNVIKNLVTVRAEERILPIVYDEKGVIEVTFATT